MPVVTFKLPLAVAVLLPELAVEVILFVTVALLFAFTLTPHPGQFVGALMLGRMIFPLSVPKIFIVITWICEFTTVKLT